MIKIIKNKSGSVITAVFLAAVLGAGVLSVPEGAFAQQTPSPYVQTPDSYMNTENPAYGAQPDIPAYTPYQDTPSSPITAANPYFNFNSGAAAPIPASGQQTLTTVIALIVYYMNEALFLLMVLAVVMFVVYIIKYFIKADADRKQAGLYVMYSVIGFFVILSLWGIVNILGNSFGLGNQSNMYQSWSQFTNIFPTR